MWISPPYTSYPQAYPQKGVGFRVLTCTCFGRFEAVSGFQTRHRAILGKARLEGQDVAGRHLSLGAWVKPLYPADQPNAFKERQVIIQC